MIVCCGEALIDFLPRTGADGAATYQPVPGGSPFNVAIATGRLGAEAGFFGGLSTDFFGDQLRQALTDSGVDLSFVATVERPTTMAFVKLENGNARYAFFDENSAGRMLTDADLPAFPKTVKALHFGSFSIASEPFGSALESLMKREQKDCVISLDPNVRPTLVRNRDGYLARLDRLVAMVDIARLSGEDLAWIAPEADFEIARSPLARPRRQGGDPDPRRRGRHRDHRRPRRLGARNRHQGGRYGRRRRYLHRRPARPPRRPGPPHQAGDRQARPREADRHADLRYPGGLGDGVAGRRQPAVAEGTRLTGAATACRRGR